MKKWFCLFMATTLMLLLLTGCSMQTTENDTQNSTTTDESVPNQTGSLPGTDDAGVSVIAGEDSLSNTKIGWGQGVETNELNIPTCCIDASKKYGNLGAIFGGEKSEQKTIALTFDQGYDNGFTEKILDTLKEKNVPGTFFITSDYIREAPEIIQRMVDEGHTLGNHTDKHVSYPSLSDEDALADSEVVRKALKEKYGVTVSLFRFPMGEFSAAKLKLLQDNGYTSVFWSFAYKDWITDNQPDKYEALEKLKEGLHPGAIYLLHSVSSTNSAILGNFIDYCMSQGYTFVTPEQQKI